MPSYRNPLYNEVLPSVASELNTRAAINGTTLRGYPIGRIQEPIMWSNGKTATAFVKTYRVTEQTTKDADGNDTTTTNVGDEFYLEPPQTNITFSEDDPPYTRAPSYKGGSGASLYSMRDRNLPRYPALRSVSITNEGRLGSVQKASVQFTVFSESQLDVVEKKVLTPGLGIDINFGWSVVVGKHSRGFFTGVIHNFNWSFNDDGSFDCTVEATGRGFFGLGVPANATIKKEVSNTSATDEAGFKMEASDLPTLIDKEIAKLSKYGKKNTVGTSGVYSSEHFPQNGIGFCVISYDHDGDAITKEKETGQTTVQQAAHTPPEAKPFYYITLNDLVRYFNTEIIKQSKRLSQSVKYAVFDENEKGSPAPYEADIVSCTPMEILFADPDPKGMSSYGDVHYTIGQHNIHDPNTRAADNAINLGYIWISTDTVKECYNSVMEKGATDPDQRRITQFFDEVFKKIAYASGDIYQLAIFMQSTNQYFNVLWIYDKNWGEHDKGLQPYHFDRSIHKALLRDLQMSAKLPSKMATQAYVGGRSSINDEPGDIPLINDEHGKSEEDKDIEENGATFVDRLYKARWQMGAFGYSEAIRDQLNSLLRAYRTKPVKKQTTASSQNTEATGTLNKDATWIRNNFYPLDVTITIDGITGFDFGNVLAIDYLPKRYKENMVFIVTNITHTISNGDWTTELTTQARMKMDVE